MVTRSMPHALLVDDDAAFQGALAEIVRQEGFTVETAENLATARDRLVAQPPDVALVDLELPDGTGFDLIPDLEQARSEIVLVTGHATVDAAVAALRTSVSDFFTKPVDVSRLKSILLNVQRRLELRGQVETLRTELRGLGRFGPLIGASPAMQQVYDLISRVAPTEATVLVHGESGTGKELVAQTVHQLSRRHHAPFVALNCGAVSPQLIESELFGHERGSFTGAARTHKGYFERAHGGTLFLDEITEMPIELQVRLLRALEMGTIYRVGAEQEIRVDVRVISATNRDPKQSVADGKLREDLLYRLSVFPIALPPLRERGDDVRLLAEHFLNELNTAEGTSKRFTRAALERIRTYRLAGERARAAELRPPRVHPRRRGRRRERAPAVVRRHPRRHRRDEHRRHRAPAPRRLVGGRGRAPAHPRDPPRVRGGQGARGANARDQPEDALQQAGQVPQQLRAPQQLSATGTAASGASTRNVRLSIRKRWTCRSVWAS